MNGLVPHLKRVKVMRMIMFVLFLPIILLLTAIEWVGERVDDIMSIVKKPYAVFERWLAKKWLNDVAKKRWTSGKWIINNTRYNPETQRQEYVDKSKAPQKAR